MFACDDMNIWKQKQRNKTLSEQQPRPRRELRRSNPPPAVSRGCC